MAVDRAGHGRQGEDRSQRCQVGNVRGKIGRKRHGRPGHVRAGRHGYFRPGQGDYRCFRAEFAFGEGQSTVSQLTAQSQIVPWRWFGKGRVPHAGRGQELGQVAAGQRKASGHHGGQLAEFSGQQRHKRYGAFRDSQGVVAKLAVELVEAQNTVAGHRLDCDFLHWEIRQPTVGQLQCCHAFHGLGFIRIDAQVETAAEPSAP